MSTLPIPTSPVELTEIPVTSGEISAFKEGFKDFGRQAPFAGFTDDEVNLAQQTFLKGLPNDSNGEQANPDGEQLLVVAPGSDAARAWRCISYAMRLGRTVAPDERRGDFLSLQHKSTAVEAVLDHQKVLAKIEELKKAKERQEAEERAERNEASTSKKGYVALSSTGITF